MQRSEQIDQLAAALATAQGQFANPARNREVDIKTQSGSSYKFRYATLDAIMDAVRKPMADNGLSLTHTLSNGDGKYRLVTTLMHKSGQWLESEQPIMTEKPGNQAFGSALTYGRRYAVTALLGICADEDDDANSADGNEVKSTTDRGKPKPPDKGEPDEVLKWATAISNAIKQSPSLTDLADLDRAIGVKSKEYGDRLNPEWVKRLKALVDDRRAELMKEQK